MWRIHWDNTTYHTFDTQAELITWVKDTAGEQWYTHGFKIEEQIDGEWTAPSVPTSFK